MSHSNNIKLLLDIQNKNIEIEEDAGELKMFKGVKSKFTTATLIFTTAYCECCGVKNEHYTVYKNGKKHQASLIYSYNNGRIEGFNNKIKKPLPLWHKPQKRRKPACNQPNET